MFEDRWGYSLTTANSEAADALTRGVDSIIACRADCSDHVNASIDADPEFPLPHAVKGLLMLGVSGFALAGAVDAILHGGRDLKPGLATLYAVVALAGMAAQGIDKHRLGVGAMVLMVAVLVAPSRGLPHLDEIRGPVAGASETAAIHQRRRGGAPL